MTVGRGQDGLDSLTGLRFCAALLVVLHHVTQSYVHLPLVSPLFYKGGGVGVTFFFLLSGFVLTWSRRPDLPVRVFYWRRFARVYPLHVLTWLVAAALLWMAGSGWGTVSAVSCLLLLQAWNPDPRYHYAMNGPSWSLSCEAFFYALFPVAVHCLARRARRPLRRLLLAWFVAALIVTLAAHAIFPHSDFLYTNPLYRFGEFLVGIALGLAVREGWRPPLRLAAAAWLAVGVYSALVAVDLACESHFGVFGHLPMRQLPPELASLAMAPPLVLLLAAAASADLAGARTVLGSPRMVRLGQWSFALYLSHLLLLEQLQKVVPEQRAWPLSIAVGLVTVTVMVALAGLLYTYVERPLEARLRRTVDPAGSPQPAAVPGPA